MSAAELRSVAELLLGRWRAGVGDADPEHCALVPIEDLERLALALGRRSGGQDWPQPWPVEVRRLMTWLRSVADKGGMYGDGRDIAPDVDAMERFLTAPESSYLARLDEVAQSTLELLHDLRMVTSKEEAWTHLRDTRIGDVHDALRAAVDLGRSAK